MRPVDFERHNIAKALFDAIKQQGGEDYVAVRIKGDTLWEVVRPIRPSLLIASLQSAPPVADRGEEE